MGVLRNRHMIEETWHDEQIVGKRKTSDFYGMGALDLADAYAWGLLGDVSGKTVVDFGCGEGQNTIRFAECGAAVYAFDISSEMVKATRKKAVERNLQDQVFAEKMAAEQLTYPDGFADLVFGHSILHHTDLASTRREVHRVLKPGGRAVFLEPLDHNPFIRLFRWLTPSRRTPTEKPLHFEGIYFFAEPFSTFNHKEFYLTALVAFACLPLRSEKVFRLLLHALGWLDKSLLTRWPKLGKYAWVTVMEFIK